MQLNYLKNNFKYLKPDEFNRGFKIRSSVAKLYCQCYYSCIFRLLGEQSISIDFDKGILDNLDDYHKFHLISLIISSGNKNKVTDSAIELVNENIRYFQNYNRKNMWYISNIHMGMLNIIDSYNISSYNDQLYTFFNKLIENEFTSTSLRYRGSINRIAAFYHYLPYIDKHRINLPEKVVNLLISDIKQNQNLLGSFCFPNGFSCIELDFTQTASYIYKMKNDEGIKEILENKLFNSQFTFNGAWALFPVGSSRLDSLIELSKMKIFKNMDFISFLWNLKRIININGYQIDNGINDLITKNTKPNLMSIFFGLITYVQLLKSLNIVKIDSKIEGLGLGYVI